MNLFSVFDPTSYYSIPFNWIIMLFVFIMIPSDYFLIKSEYSGFFKNFLKHLKHVFVEVSFPNYSAIVFMSVTVFLYLVISNLLSLFPFVFTSTAHPFITMGWGILLWLSFILMGFIKNFKNSLAHLVPEGSPFILAPLMVVIESISHMIRPFTLSIRLAANMMAGHLIIGLLASISLIDVYSFSVSLIFQSFLLLLEFGVAIIQGFVFSILLLLYSLDYY